MYQVLLVDDEPLILLGIKSMIDWGKNGCALPDTARDGQQALKKIRARHPDIVICDIAMPGMSGDELLQQVTGEFPEVVFIMLTSHPDFHLAQHALRHHAVDYLLKNEMDPPVLERALAHAQKERASRTKLANANLVNDYLESNRQNMLEQAFFTMVKSQPGMTNESAVRFLNENGVLEQYMVLYIPLQFEQVPGYADFTPQERSKLFEWVRDICEKTIAALYPNCAVFSPDEAVKSDVLFALCWKIAETERPRRLHACAEKVISACTNITQASARVLATTCLNGPNDLEACRRQVFELRDQYYWTGGNGILYEELPPVTWGRLALTGFANRLIAEIRVSSAAACATLLDCAVKRVQAVPHQQSQALWLCGEIYRAVAEGLGPEAAAALPDCERLVTRSQVLRWLEIVKNELTDTLEQNAPAGRSALVEKARQYVQENVEKRIMLQDAADYVCISPGYLSALFKKQYNQNFVDYINEVKTNRACELIRSGQYKIYEISYMLGFENAYYFTRVFKRHTGKTPTEYQKSLRAPPPPKK